MKPRTFKMKGMISLSSEKNFPLFFIPSQSFHVSPSRRALPEVAAFVGGTFAYTFVDYANNPYVSAARAKQEERQRLFYAMVFGVTISAITFFVNNSSKKIAETATFDEILSEILTSYKYSESEMNAIVILFKIHGIDLNNFKKEHSKVDYHQWRNDDMRLWILSKLEAIHKSLQNSTAGQLGKISDDYDKMRVNQCFSMLNLSATKDDLNEKSYRKFMTDFCNQIAKKNNAYLEKELGIKLSNS